jgi:hypothetical protein
LSGRQGRAYVRTRATSASRSERLTFTEPASESLSEGRPRIDTAFTALEVSQLAAARATDRGARKTGSNHAGPSPFLSHHAEPAFTLMRDSFSVTDADLASAVVCARFAPPEKPLLRPNQVIGEVHAVPARHSVPAGAGAVSEQSLRRVRSRDGRSVQLTSRGGRPFPPTQLFTARPRLGLCCEPGASPVHKLLYDANLPKSHLFQSQDEFQFKERQPCERIELS